ncbi:uncharacterized protein LOC113381807 [Ctenocephalides felis]|uniref:uncharacterized protein LOC113381807 n=1 Tax=Ctenocephalides felis TaxID=7515 RepID=UPI000E6E5A0B|nr:uncharacterized protein LOC113381807 [Ctenocephalides felis]
MHFEQIPIPKNAAASPRRVKTITRRRLVTPMSTSPTPYNLEMVSSTTSSKQINSNSRVSSTTHKSVKLASKPEKASTATNLQPKNNLKAGNARVSKAIQNEVEATTVKITPTSVRPPTRRDTFTCPPSNNWQLFALFCGRDADCYHMGNSWLCCRGRCLQGKEKQRAEIKHEPLRAAASYLQCTPPPPPVIDFNPTPCNSTADCFPNLCCQERGKKHCRPPQKNIISLLASMTQRFGSGIWKMIQVSSSPQLNNL